MLRVLVLNLFMFDSQLLLPWFHILFPSRGQRRIGRTKLARFFGFHGRSPKLSNKAVTKTLIQYDRIYRSHFGRKCIRSEPNL